MTIETSSLKFSGHQTFPLRYGWIYKIVQEVTRNVSISSKDTIEEQMVTMGMGKNMVLSARHWIRTINLVQCVDAKKQKYELTDLATRLFTGHEDKPAYDKYLDKVGTIWLLHWLCQTIPSNKAELNTARWFFNYFNGVRIDKVQLRKEIELALAGHEKSVTEATLKKDIDCFFQSYVTDRASGKKPTEDSFTSPFTELGLVTYTGSNYSLAELSSRKTLPVEIFAYACISFFQRQYVEVDNPSFMSNTVAFDTLLSGVGSPGRIFRLTANGLSEQLDNLERLTNGKIAWIDTQGLRQVQHQFPDIRAVDPALYLENYYQK